MFRLTDDEMKSLKPDVPNCRQPVFDCEGCSAQCGLTAKAQLIKIADKVEDMANDGMWVGEVLKALREEGS